MIYHNGKQVGFIYKGNKLIERIYKNGKLYYEKGFLRELIGTSPLTIRGVALPLKNYEVFGNTKQETTTGKNQLNLLKYKNVGRIYNQNNITVDLLEDGTLLINGTNNTGSNIIITFTSTEDIDGTNKKITNVLINGEYTSSPSKTNFAFVMYSSNYENAKGVLINATNNLINNAKYSILRLTIYDGASANNLRLGFMIQDTSILNTDFEPYTNGASPNPDYPQEIESVGDRTINNFDGELERGIWSNDKGIKVNSTTAIRSVNYIKVKPDTTYTISAENDVSIYSHEYDSDKNFITTKAIVGTPRTFTTSNNAEYITINTRGSENITNTQLKIQIEEGSTATEYEPYGYKIPVNVRSENLFDKDSCDIGTSWHGASNSARARFYIKFTPNQDYSIKIDDFKDLKDISVVEFYGFNGAYYKYNKLYNAPFTLTRKFDSEAIYLGLQFSVDGIMTQEIIDKIKLQLNLGTQPKPYQPYYNTTTNIYLDQPLRKIDDYADCIDWKEQKVVRNIGEVILDGSEDWKYLSSVSNPYFYINYTNKDKPYKLNSDLFCNLLINKTVNQNIDKTMQIGSNYFAMTILKSIQNVSDFKDWVSTNKPIVDYILATPTEETIELPEILTTTGNNIITIDTKVNPSNVWIKYKSNK